MAAKCNKLRHSLGHARKVSHPVGFMEATRLYLHSDWELKPPLRVQVGSSIRKAMQAMGLAAMGPSPSSSSSSVRRAGLRRGW